MANNPICFLSDKKRKKEDGKVRPEVKPKEKAAEEEKKKDKPKAYAPSHAKIRSTGKSPLLFIYYSIIWVEGVMFMIQRHLHC